MQFQYGYHPQGAIIACNPNSKENLIFYYLDQTITCQPSQWERGVKNVKFWITSKEFHGENWKTLGENFKKLILFFFLLYINLFVSGQIDYSHQKN